MVLAAVKVSILAMGVIFLVLTVLIGVIQLLVKFIPYKAPPAPPARNMAPTAGSGTEEEAETLAAIHVAVAHHRGETPQAIQITNIQSS